MFLTGFADEASRDLKEQIRATEELGWKFIETRFIGNKNLGTISDAEFEDVLEILSQTDVRFNCYGSNIANWGKSPRSDCGFRSQQEGAPYRHSAYAQTRYQNGPRHELQACDGGNFRQSPILKKSFSQRSGNWSASAKARASSTDMRTALLRRSVLASHPAPAGQHQFRQLQADFRHRQSDFQLQPPRTETLQASEQLGILFQRA